MKHSPGVHLFVCCVTLFFVVAGEAQNTSLSKPGSSSPTAPSLERKIEVLIRSQFSVPPEYDILLGARSKSNTEGYDTLPVSFIHEGKQTSVDFSFPGMA